ncbi:molecular chaperone TorD family protein [Breoghania sp.]|uniref:molecular chaperone TorD family protein n=1 Tax=Breoghania sp. TaxID=2065378 RepID=UPI002AAB27C5|nr:molecular chaperone TorD family protein [Breoghania sp.]
MTMTTPPSGPAYTEAVAVFSSVFGAPLETIDIESIHRPLDEGPLAQLAAIPAIRDAVADLRKTVIAQGEPQKGVSELNKAFCKLFMGLGGPRSAPPYESAYTGDGRLFQEPAREMEKLLQKQGLAASEDFPEAADHLALELSLMEETLRLAGLTEDRDDIALVRDLHTRLMGWVPNFAGACVAHDPSGFYARAAQLLLAFLKLPHPKLAPAAA